MIERIETVEFYGHILDIYGSVNDPLFLARDIAKLIDYSTGRIAEMVETVDDSEKLISVISMSGQRRNMWFLTEDGLYEILMQSRKPIAREFKGFIKRLLHDMRRSYTTFADYAEMISLQEDFDSLNILREDMGLPPMSLTEYLKRRRNGDWNE